LYAGAVALVVAARPTNVEVAGDPVPQATPEATIRTVFDDARERPESCIAQGSVSVHAKAPGKSGPPNWKDPIRTVKVVS
jgi:hypothetical protein